MRIRTRLGRLKREVFCTPALNHIVVEPLLAALCDPLIAARVVTVDERAGGEHAADGVATSLRCASHWLRADHMLTVASSPLLSLSLSLSTSRTSIP